MLAKVLTTTGLVSAGLLLILVTTTTPSSAGAFGILSIFVLSYMVILTSFTFLLWFTAVLINRAGRLSHSRRKAYILPLKKAYYYSTIIALAPVIMVSLQTVGGVGLYEIILIAMFIGLGCLYVYKRTG